MVIPSQFGIQAISNFLHSLDATTDPLCPLLELVLENNVFIYGHDFYLQTWGVAMGTPYVNSYSNLVLAQWEKVKLLCDVNPWYKHLLYYGCFTEDIFIFWKGDAGQYSRFTDYLNHTTKFLKFQFDCSETEINFLDAKVLLHPVKGLQTSLHRKYTWRNYYLHRQSMHPNHIFKNILKNQVTRISRLCTNDADFSREFTDLHHNLRARGYRDMDLKLTADINTIRTNQGWPYFSESLSPVPFRDTQTKNMPLKCLMTFSSDNKHVCDTIRKYWPVLTADERIRNIVGDHPSFSFKNRKNIKCLLCNKDGFAQQVSLTRQRTFRC
ncbi:uncharacterized protein LOC122796966 [Protopterus annectens]|uniref:uncharacterized protein LOC122796966 n=1 Tax=Protopterus annectens TaxID=7888 RepID=UPI001CF9A9A6|nr:uncharacterized protein LOC122796966 [Protopterus annectens]